MIRIDRSNPDAVLRHAAGVTLETAVRRILRAFDAATPANVEAGVRWYDGASEIVDAVAAAGNVSREHAAAVIAHLSPRTTWQRNVAGAFGLVTGTGTHGCMGANVARAIGALGSADPLSTLHGPKTAAFARNITGDRDAVTVDVWAVRVALAPAWSRGSGSDAETILGRSGVYAAVAHAYRVAARRRGVDPTTMQATAWIVVRNGRAA